LQQDLVILLNSNSAKNMVYYKLENTLEALQWRLGLTEEENRRTNFLERFMFEVNRFWDFEEPLKLQLWYRKSDNPSHRNIGYCDVHDWIGDELDHHPPLRGKPLIYSMIISDRLKGYIDNFFLPKHKFYLVKAIKEDTLEQRNYFIFQILNEQYANLYYPAVTFALRKGPRILKEFGKGEVKNYEHLLSILEEEKKQQKGVTMSYQNSVIIRHYDILWGAAGEILFSQNLKDRLDALDLEGVAFIPYERDILFSVNS
jgi:hypothetical protein